MHSKFFKELQKRNQVKQTEIHERLGTLCFDDIDNILYNSDLGNYKPFYYSFKFYDDQKIDAIASLGAYIPEIKDNFKACGHILGSLEVSFYSLLCSSSFPKLFRSSEDRKEIRAIIKDVSYLVVAIPELKAKLLEGPSKDSSKVKRIGQFVGVADQFENILDAAEEFRLTLENSALSLEKYLKGVEIKTEVPQDLDVCAGILDKLARMRKSKRSEAIHK